MAIDIAAELRFGGHSQTWGGGVAFVVPSETSTTLARLYLITKGQLEDIVAQENWLDPGSVDLDTFDGSDGKTVLFYGVLVDLGPHEGRPTWAISQDPATPSNPPSARYLAHIATGLREAHGLSDAEVDAYLSVRTDGELFGS